MQQQVMKRNMSSDMGWGIGEGGGWGQHTSAPGSGSWTSTANQDNSSSNWQAMGKSDNASDAGDDASSIKSGSTITNSSNINPQQSQDSTITTSAASSSSPWSTNPTLSGMDSGPWGNSSSPAPTSLNSLGWNTNPASLSLNNNQGHNNGIQQGPSVIGSSSNFNSSSTASSGWPSGLTGNSMASTASLPPNMNSGLPSGNLSSQWPGSNMLAKMDFPKTSDATWNTPASTLMENKDLSVGSDPRMWGLVDKSVDQNWEPPKSQWGNTPIVGDQGASNNTELSFAQATQKGLKMPPAASAPQGGLTSRQEEILRAIENHEGWGSRPIRQDTSWDIDNSPKSHRKFPVDNNAGASNVWNNSNGTAIWEAVRENQGSNWGGATGNTGNTSWNDNKDQNWGGPPKQQDPNTWVVGAGGGNGDPKSFGTWEGGGGAGDASNKMWAQKTNAIGSWGEASNVQRSTSISSWGEDGETSNWEDQRRITGGMSSIQSMVPPSPGIGAPSGMAGMIPQNIPGMNMAGMGTESTPWNSANASAINRTKIDEPWNKPPPKISGWGDPGQESLKVDDGTGIWAANAPKQLPPQAKATGWGDAGSQSQWNSAVGAKPRAPAGWDEASWAMAQQRTKQQMPPKYMNSSNNQPTQMRSKLLQHLMDMGYRREEAQSALITNNMNLELAINDLKQNNGMQRKDLDMDIFQANGSQNRMPYMPKAGMGGDDMGDSHPDQVPNFSTSLQNTPFPNAQAPNQPYMQGNPSLPPSSLNPSSSINPNLQQKLMQKMQQVPPTPALGPRNQMPPNQVPQQQQQQILAQLRQAVSNGYISPQLLNYQLPHNILVLLQQLLQLQSTRQSVITKLQQARASGNRANQQQLEQLVNSINQQINILQKSLQQAQANLFQTQKLPNMSQPPSGMITPLPNSQQGAVGENIDAISSDLANVAINQSQSQSRLTTQWKSDPSGAADGSSTPTITATTAASSEGDDKALKGALQSSSSPNLNLIPGGLGMTGDRTWSSMATTTTSNWPMSSSDNSAGNSSLSDSKVSNTSSTSTSSILSGMPTGLTDVIPEFVPGKPWQGLSTKNVEDDPHVTPGSMIQRSLSVNRVHDESLNNLDGHKFSGSNWGNNSKNENSLGLSQLGNRPPPGMAPTKMTGSPQWQSGNPYNRQTSWAGRSNTSAFTQVGTPNWNDHNQQMSSWILLKNLNSSLDSATVRALCAQHGNLASFIPQGQAALVQYTGRDMAYNAMQRLNNFQIGNTIIAAELINENDAQRVASQMPPPQPSSAMPPINASQWSHAPPTFQSSGARSGDPWGNTMPAPQHMSKFGSMGADPWGGSGLWGDMNSLNDHNSNQLLSNILGGESM